MCRPGATLVAVAAALAAQLVGAIQPRLEGHFLTNTELRNISAIACLEARQKNPAVHCHGSAALAAGSGFSGRLNAGNYPHYQDVVCNSNGEFFCDPSGIFSMEERANLTAELTQLREDNPVTCGHLLNDPVDPRHYQPFYLGIVMATNWNSGESDPESLQQFGQIIAAQWNMDKKFGGSPEPYLRCPNTAVLVFLPQIHTAFLSSASCEFVCQRRGGPEVVTATLMALHTHGKMAAVKAGMREVYSVVTKTGMNNGDDLKKETWMNVTGVIGAVAEKIESGSTLAWIQRVLFFLAVIAFVLSLALGVAVLLLAPGWLPRRRK